MAEDRKQMTDDRVQMAEVRWWRMAHAFRWNCNRINWDKNRRL